MTDDEIKELIEMHTQCAADALRIFAADPEPSVKYFGERSARTAAALTQLLAERQWQPIETAPDDGPVIIQVTDETRDPIVGEAMWFDDGDGGDWWWAGTRPGDYHAGPISEMNFGKPTHWMPLPAPIAQVVQPKLNT